MTDSELYRRRLVERLEGDLRAAHEAIERARADEARAHARVAEVIAAIERVRTSREPAPDECKRCRFEFGRTSVLRPVPTRKGPQVFQCPLCGDEETRTA